MIQTLRRKSRKLKTKLSRYSLSLYDIKVGKNLPTWEVDRSAFRSALPNADLVFEGCYSVSTSVGDIMKWV
jgi:hypothetical protein